MHSHRTQKIRNRQSPTARKPTFQSACPTAQQYDHTGGDGGGAADVADAFAGLGFDANLIDRDVHGLGKLRSHLVDVSRHLRTLGQDHAVQIDDFHPPAVNPMNRFGQKIDAVAATVLGIVVRKQTADVLFGDRTEQPISNRVHQHIGIAVPDRVDFRRDVDSANAKRAAVAESVRIVAQADAER